MSIFNWEYPNPAGTAQQAANTKPLRRVLSVAAPSAGDAEGMAQDHWKILSQLPLLAADKAYLHGVFNILQLPEEYARLLALEYVKRWQAGYQRCTNPNGKDNAGRKAANVWIQQGAAGLLQWSDD